MTSSDDAKIARTPSGGFYLQGGYTSAMTGKAIPVCRLKTPPRFVPSHKAEGSRTVNGVRQTTWIEPDRVHGYQYWSTIKKGGTVDTIRLLDVPEVVAQIDELDAEEAGLRERLTEIHRERQKAYSVVWPACPSLRVADIKEQPKP